LKLFILEETPFIVKIMDVTGKLAIIGTNKTIPPT